MLVTYNATRSRFEAEFGFDEFRASHPLVKQAGFAFDGKSNPKVWHTAGYKAPKPLLEQAKIAAKLRQYCDEDACSKLDGLLGSTPVATIQEERAAVQVAVAASRAETSDLVIPVPEGIDPNTGKPFAYLPFQKAGVQYAMCRLNTLIGDEMGLGKTIQAIGISNMDPSVRKVIIVCPATPKINWMKEWKKWDIKKLTVGLADTQNGIPNTDVIITNYEQLVKLGAKLKDREWDLLIVDECHKAKNPKADRTQFLLGTKKEQKKTKVSRKKDKVTGIVKETKTEVVVPIIPPFMARRRVFLTGTPILNRPVELWPLCEALDPDGLGKSFWNFVTRYCGAKQTRFGWDFTGATNLDELQEKLRSSFMVRRLKADVLKELPPKRRQVVILEAEGNLRDLIKREKAAYAQLEKAQKEGKSKLESISVDMTQMSALRKETAIAKVPLIVETLRDMLENEEKLVVMCHHDDVVQALQKEFGNDAVSLNCNTPQKLRDPNVVRFQTDPTCKLFIGTIQAAGVAITLTAASKMVFAELDWVPGNMSQAEDRIHRIGQLMHCLYLFLVVDESLDANMVEKLIEKTAIISAALDEKRAEKPAPEMPEVGLAPKTEAAPKKLYGRDGKELPVLTEAQTLAVHNAMKLLRSRCDGAHEEDGKGFAGPDVHFGWAMAAAEKLSPKMAAYGQKMVRKYQGQLGSEMCRAAGVEPKHA